MRRSTILLCYMGAGGSLCGLVLAAQAIWWILPTAIEQNTLNVVWYGTLDFIYSAGSPAGLIVDVTAVLAVCVTPWADLIRRSAQALTRT
jgi:hypothetical protein